MSSKPFQKLTAYYKQTTLFNVIGTERSENRHSAFLRWLLSPDSSHGLGTAPLKLFLRLIATLESGKQTFGDVLYRKVLAGNYELELLEPVDVEKNVGKLSVQDDENNEKTSKDRIDIWTVACLTYEEDGEEMKCAVPIVVENKIYSKEGEDQTKRYYAAMSNYIDEKEKEEVPPSPPKTNDDSPILPVAGLMALSLAGITVVSSKKRKDKRNK